MTRIPGTGLHDHNPVDELYRNQSKSQLKERLHSLDSDWNKMMDLLECDETEVALRKIRRLKRAVEMVPRSRVAQILLEMVKFPLYEQILDLPEFAYHFNQLVLLAQDLERENRAMKTDPSCGSGTTDLS